MLWPLIDTIARVVFKISKIPGVTNPILRWVIITLLVVFFIFGPILIRRICFKSKLIRPHISPLGNSTLDLLYIFIMLLTGFTRIATIAVVILAYIFIKILGVMKNVKETE